MSRLGILGVGTHLPPDVRRNDWWDPALTASWSIPRPPANAARSSHDQLSEGARLALEAIQQYNEDPFRGAIERRVLAPELNASDMEVEAAQKALEAAGVSADEIDFLFVYSLVPDFAGPTNAGLIHRRLRLSGSCFTTCVDGACNSFLLQLTMAESMILSGRFRRGLIIQSSIGSRATLPTDPLSAVFGDGASALVVGAVDEAGLVAVENRTHGGRHSALVIGNETGRWIDAGRPHMYVHNPSAAMSMLLSIADRCRDAVTTVIDRAGWTKESVSFYACHQPSPWFLPLTQKYCGLEEARSVKRFEQIGSLSGANIPFVLQGAVDAKLLHQGDRVVMFGGGAGETWSSAALIWGGA